MKRLVYVLLCLAVTGMIFAGCGNSGNTGNDKPEDVVEETYETESADELTEAEEEEKEEVADEVSEPEEAEDEDALAPEDDTVKEIPEEEQIDKPMGSGGGPGPDYEGE